MFYYDALNLMNDKQSLGIKPGLDRIKKLLDRMGNPQDDIKIIHIAGTNGKGTIAKTISNALIDNGYRVGLFSSPWVVNYREQISINNQYISKDDFTAYVERYRLNNDCTEFEFLTAIMYKYFADNNVDYAVVECGMGGLEDSTNVEKENISVITHISLDHTSFLGETIEEIAYQKAGIRRDNCPCVVYPNPECESVFKGATIVEESNDYALNNLNTAKEVLKLLGVNSDVTLASLPCRMETINGVLIDGGHNVDAASVLEKEINDEIALIGMMKDKDVEGYISKIAPKCKGIITTAPNNSRSISAEELKEIANKYCDDVVAIDNPVEAITFGKKNELSLICGSFYLCREVRNLII